MKTIDPERDAFGGHPHAVQAIREHRAWHDLEQGKSAVCWKDAEYVRYLLALVKDVRHAAEVLADEAYESGGEVAEFIEQRRTDNARSMVPATLRSADAAREGGAPCTFTEEKTSD